MPRFLLASDPLPQRPRRVLVAGTSGSGKTTLARRLGDALNEPFVEIDALFHGPGWTAHPTFLADVDAFSSRPGWVTEWQYGDVRTLLAERADLMVWLDLPRRTVMRQVVVRTLDRRLRRRVLWNGNIEPPLATFFTDPQHIVRWAWSTDARNQHRMLTGAQRPPELPVVRLRSHRESRAWLAGPLARSLRDAR